MNILKQSVAVDVLIGPFVDATNGYTTEEALSPSVLLSKNGQTLAAKNDVTTPTHDDAGYYNCELDATDTNTVGTLRLVVESSATHLAVFHDFQVVEEAIYDALFAASATGLLPANVTQFGGSAGTFASGIPAVNATQVEGSDATNQIRDAVVDDATRIDASALNTASAAIGSDGSGLIEAGGTGDQFTALPWNASWDAEVESEVNDGLVALKLDHLVAVADADDPVNNSIIAKLAASDGDWSGFSAATDSLEALRDQGDSAWITATGFSTHSAADVWAVGTRVLTANTNLNDPTAAAIADQVWDEATVGHTTAGTFGAQSKTVVDEIRDDTNELQSDDIPATLATIAGYIDTEIAAIIATLGTSGDGLTAIPWNASWDAQVQSEVTDALNAYDPPTNAQMEARTLVAAEYATATALAATDLVVDATKVVVDGIKAVTDNLPDSGALTTIDGNIDALNSGIITGSAVTGTLSTTQASTNLTGYADDQLIGRVVIWTSGACEGEATDITDYANTNGVLTFTALTTAPANNDAFKIV